MQVSREGVRKDSEHVVLEFGDERNRGETQPITEPDQAKEGILMVDLKKLVTFIAEVKSKTENTDNRKGSSSSPKYQRVNMGGGEE